MDALKQLLTTRLAQVLARYIGYALAALLAKIGVESADIQSAINPESIATAIGLIIAVVIDHWSHGQQNGGGTGGVSGTFMKGWRAGFTCLIALPFLAGCFAVPVAVKDAQKLERLAQDQVTENQARVIEMLITAYSDQAYAAIDGAVQRDLDKGAATAGGTPAQAMIYAAGRYAVRDAQRQAVDDTCRQLREIAALARSDKTIAKNLRDALDRYDKAQADPAAISKAVTEIINRFIPIKPP